MEIRCAKAPCGLVPPYHRVEWMIPTEALLRRCRDHRITVGIGILVRFRSGTSSKWSTEWLSSGVGMGWSPRASSSAGNMPGPRNSLGKEGSLLDKILGPCGLVYAAGKKISALDGHHEAERVQREPGADVVTPQPPIHSPENARASTFLSSNSALEAILIASPMVTSRWIRSIGIDGSTPRACASPRGRRWTRAGASTSS